MGKSKIVEKLKYGMQTLNEKWDQLEPVGRIIARENTVIFSEDNNPVLFRFGCSPGLCCRCG